MRFSTTTLSLILAVSAPIIGSGFVQNTAFSRAAVSVISSSNDNTFLQMSEPEVAATESEEIPSEVIAMDGIESDEEAHNVERPARASGTAKHSKKREWNCPLGT